MGRLRRGCVVTLGDTGCSENWLIVNNIGVNSIRLRERRPRVKAFGYDKDKDWRKEQVLYD